MGKTCMASLLFNEIVCVGGAWPWGLRIYVYVTLLAQVPERETDYAGEDRGALEEKASAYDIRKPRW